MNKKTKKISKIVAISAGATAIAAGSYYLFGPKGAKHRSDAKNWMNEMKDEVLEKISNIKNLSEDEFHKIIDTIVFAYIATGEVATPELETFANNLKSQWKNIVKLSAKKKKVVSKKVNKKKS